MRRPKKAWRRRVGVTVREVVGLISAHAVALDQQQRRKVGGIIHTAFEQLVRAERIAMNERAQVRRG